jgi:DNA modification methylase
MSTTEIRNIELYKNATPLLDTYPDYQTLNLPMWVLENIENARVYGNKKRGVILADGRKYHLDNKLNSMTGRDWTLFINSVFTTHYPTRGKEGYAHEIRKIHPTPKPPQLMRDIIQFFSKEGELIFDYFAGVGGTLLGASLCGRKAAGIELNQSYIEAYHNATKELDLQDFDIVQGDALAILDNDDIMKNLTNGEKISLVLIDPPYSNMMSKEKTGADISVYGNIATPFTSEDTDLGNMSREDFLNTLKRSVDLVWKYIKTEGYIVVFIKDLQPSKKELNLLHAEVIQKLNEIEKLYYKGMKIWADSSAKMYPYGYPFSFVANQIHQYILIFRKEK